MSRTFNKVMLIGNVGKEPVLKHTPGGVPVTSFRIATSETWKDRGGNFRERTDWHTVVAWRGLAEVITKIVTKGSRIFIEGKLQSRSFEDSGGKRKHVVEILADTMLLLEKRKKRRDKNNENQGEEEYKNQESPKESSEKKDYEEHEQKGNQENYVNQDSESQTESKNEYVSENNSETDSKESEEKGEENKNVDTFLF